MKVTEPTPRDVEMATSTLQLLLVADKLLDSLKLGGFPVSGPGIDRRAESLQWFASVVRGTRGEGAVAAPASSPPAVAPSPPAASATGGFKVKAMGPLAPPPRGRGRKR